MSGCGCQVAAKNAAQRRVIGYLLLINGTMFMLEIMTGVLVQSTALIADSLDMLADAAVLRTVSYTLLLKPNSGLNRIRGSITVMKKIYTSCDFCLLGLRNKRSARGDCLCLQCRRGTSRRLIVSTA